MAQQTTIAPVDRSSAALVPTFKMLSAQKTERTEWRRRSTHTHTHTTRPAYIELTAFHSTSEIDSINFSFFFLFSFSLGAMSEHRVLIVLYLFAL